MEITLVAVVVLLWLAVTGRLANALSVLTSPAPAQPKSTTNQTSAGVAANVGWAPLDMRNFEAPLNQTLSTVRGTPIKEQPGGISIERYR